MMNKTIIPAQLIQNIYRYLLDTRPMGEVRHMVDGLEVIIKAELNAQKGNGVPAPTSTDEPTKDVQADG